MLAVFMILEVLAGYVCAKGVYCITRKTWLSVLLVLFTLVIPFSFFTMLYGAKSGRLLSLICYIGYVYLGFLMYFSICCLVLYLAFRINKKVNLKKTLSFGLVGVSILLMIGYVNAINPKLTKISVPSSNTEKRICFVSDIHVGSISSMVILNKVSKLIEQANPDMVIFGGDVLDVEAMHTYDNEFIAVMQKISSRYKTFAVIGNHEIYAGFKDCVNLLKNAGIHVLLDSSTKIDEITLVGRLDQSLYWRKPLSKIVPTDSKNVIVIDHAPVAIDESAQSRAILHLSGHTHGGQMFPINVLADLLYAWPTGKLGKIQNTYFYTTYGAGFWGPPYRLGNRPEVVLIELGK